MIANNKTFVNFDEQSLVQNGLASDYFSSLLILLSRNPRLRQLHDNLQLATPVVSIVFDRQAFSVFAPLMWLPLTLRQKPFHWSFQEGTYNPLIQNKLSNLKRVNWTDKHVTCVSYVMMFSRCLILLYNVLSCRWMDNSNNTNENHDYYIPMRPHESMLNAWARSVLAETNKHDFNTRCLLPSNTLYTQTHFV